MSPNRRLLTRPLTVYSFAKINLGLKIIGRRADGFHELRTVFQTIDLCDRLRFTPRRDGRLHLTCADPQLPVNRANLVLRAARLLRSETGSAQGFDIHLEKKIPVGAGLGGGSSNAAATLLAIHRMARLRLTTAQLLALAAKLGADVPFFLIGGRALGIGRGDELIPLRDARPTPLLVACPNLSISTREAYQEASLWLTNKRRPNNMTRFLSEVFEKESALELFENDFESVLFPEYAKLRRLKATLLAAGARAALMTGSGSALFGVFSSPAAARRAEVQLQSSHSTSRLSTFVAHSLPRSQYWKRIFAASI